LGEVLFRMKLIIVLSICMGMLFGAQTIQKVWGEGQTFSAYLEENNISTSLLEGLSVEDRAFLSEIRKDARYYEVRDANASLLQALIPVSDQMQIDLFCDANHSSCSFKMIPIVYEEQRYFAKVKIVSNPSLDIVNTIGSPKVAKRVSLALKSVVDTTKFHQGDSLAFLYWQKSRLDHPYGMPKVDIVQVTMQKKPRFIYVDSEGVGYKSMAKKQYYTTTTKKEIHYKKRVPISKKNGRFGMPLRHIRVTSSFSLHRWHPILHRYRPHHGTDFGARKGTPLLAVNAGRVIFAGRMGGYGKVVKIRHDGGYESLYAHQSRIRVKRGQWVKKGQIIGYVGSTGRSTGPHLHFGLKKNGRWVDPMKVLGKKSIKTTVLKTFTKYKDVKEKHYKMVDLKGAKQQQEELIEALENNASTYIWSDGDE